MNIAADQNIQFTFDRGLNSKADPKLSNGMLELTNAQFVKAGSVQKRRGFTSLSSSYVSSSLTASATGSLTTGSSLATYGSELLLFTTSSVYSYAQARNVWTYKNELYPTTVAEESIIANNDFQFAAQSARSGSLRVVAWRDIQNRSVNASIQDVTSKTFYISNAVLATASSAGAIDGIFGGPKVVPCGNYFYIFYLNQNRIQWRRVDINDPTYFSDETIVAASGTVSVGYVNMFDAYAWKNHSSGECMVLTHISASSIVSRRLNSSGVAVNTTTNVISNGVDDIYFIAGTTSSVQVLFRSTTGSTTYAEVIQYNTTMGSITSSNGFMTVSDVSGGDAKKAAGFQLNNSGAYGTIQWFLEVQQQYRDIQGRNKEHNYKFNYIKTGSYNQGVVTPEGIFLYNASIGCEPFRLNGRGFLGVTHESEIQGTHFVVEV